MAKGTRSISLTQEIKATPEAIYPMLVEGDQLKRWFPTKAETDPVLGGHYMFITESQKGSKETKGTFLELVPNKRVRYTWPTENTEVEFEIISKGDTSEIRVTHTGFAETGNDETVTATTRGWTFFLSNLKSLLEEGIDRRTDKW